MDKVVTKIGERGKGSVGDLARRTVAAAIAFVALDEWNGSTSEPFHNWEEVGTKEVFEKLKIFQFTELVCGEDAIRRELTDMHKDGEVTVDLTQGKEYLRISEKLKKEIFSYAEEE